MGLIIKINSKPVSYLDSDLFGHKSRKVGKSFTNVVLSLHDLGTQL
jgi:hypothetical protein